MVSSFIWIYTNGAILNCEYSLNYHNEFDVNNEYYQCKGEVLQLNENDTTIKSVTKPTDSYKTLSDVQELRIENQKLIRFPSDDGKYFKSIYALTVKNTTITDIANENLKHFPLLNYLDLSSNQISVISKDLFIFNENLNFINFARNNIVFLNPETFDGLKSLKVIDFSNNIGINEQVASSDAINYFKIKLLIKNLEKRQTETMEKLFVWLAKCEFKFGNSAF